jgi:hypothetical protein
LIDGALPSRARTGPTVLLDAALQESTQNSALDTLKRQDFPIQYLSAGLGKSHLLRLEND